MPNQKKKIVIKDVQFESINKILSTVAFALIAMIGLRYIGRELIAPILLAVFITILMYPIFKWFRRRGLGSKVSLIFMMVTFFGGAALVIIFLTWSFSLMAQSISGLITGFKENLDSTAAAVNVSTTQTQSIKDSITPENVQKIISAIINSFGSIALYFIVVPILSILMLLQVDSIPKGMTETLSKSNPGLIRVRKFADSIMIYMSVRFKECLVTGIVFGTGLYIMGVEFAIVWGLLTIVMGFVPYIGIAIASIPPMLIAFSQYGLTGALLVLALMILCNILTENILEPVLQGRGNKISTAAIVISLIFWVWLLGPIGAILSVPLTVVLKLVLADFKETHLLALLMEGNYSAKELKTEKGAFMSFVGKVVKKIPGKK